MENNNKNDNKTFTTGFRVNSNEKAQVLAMVKEAGCKDVSEFLKMVVLNDGHNYIENRYSKSEAELALEEKIKEYANTIKENLIAIEETNEILKREQAVNKDYGIFEMACLIDLKLYHYKKKESFSIEKLEIKKWNLAAYDFIENILKDDQEFKTSNFRITTTRNNYIVETLIKTK